MQVYGQRLEHLSNGHKARPANVAIKQFMHSAMSTFGISARLLCDDDGDPHLRNCSVITVGLHRQAGGAGAEVETEVEAGAAGAADGAACRLQLVAIVQRTLLCVYLS